MNDLDRVLDEVERLDRERQRLVVAAIGSPVTANLLAGMTSRAADAAPLLAAEVRRLRAQLAPRTTDPNEQIAHLDRLIRCYRTRTLYMGGMDAIVTSAAALIDEVKQLRAELEEARLTLAAEQMRPEGAPPEGWRTDGEVWVKDYPDRTQAGVQPDGLWWRGEWHKPARWHGRANSRRAGMLAADAAAG